MLERIPNKSVEKAILGDIESSRAKTIDLTADNIKKIINGHDTRGTKVADGRARKLISDLANPGEWRTDNVTSLIATANDPNKPRNRDVAEERLDILTTATYIAMKYGNNPKNIEAIECGSIDKILAVLPLAMRDLKFAEKVRNVEIANQEIRDVLDEMDRKNRIAEGMGRNGEALVGGNIYNALNKLSSIQISGDKDERDIMVISAYLGYQLDVHGVSVVDGGRRTDAGGDTYAEFMDKLKKEVSRQGVTRGVTAGQDGSSVGMGELEASRALEEVPQLVSATKDGVMVWTVQTLDWLAREPLFFAGAGWQQFEPYMEREVRKVFKVEGMKEKETLEAIEMVRAVVAPRVYEEAMMRSDGAIGVLVKHLPPAGVYDLIAWTSDRRKLLLKNEMISYFYDEIYNAVESKTALSLGMMADSEVSNIMAENLVDNLLSDDEKVDGLLKNNSGNVDAMLLQSLARVSVSMFNIDSIPDVIMHANHHPEQYVGLIDQVKKKRKLNSERMVGEVVVYDTMFNRTLGYSHPLVGLRRPVDVFRANNVWNEVILGEAEQALWFLGENLFVIKEGTGNNEKRRFSRWSEINVKTLDRWDAMMSAFFGGTQAESLDSFDDVQKGLEKMQKLIQNNPEMENIGGAVAGKIIKAKVMALLAENRSGFSNNMIRALALERSSVPKELSDALGKMTGSGMDSSFGAIKEAVSRLGFNFIGNTDMTQAIDMLVTESNDPRQAEKNLRIKKAALVLKAIVDLGSEVGGGGGRKK